MEPDAGLNGLHEVVRLTLGNDSNTRLDLESKLNLLVVPTTTRISSLSTYSQKGNSSAGYGHICPAK